MEAGKQIRNISLYTATSIVIANMVGTGVFTSLGFQVQGIKDPTALVLLWIIGGITALCGALTYAELGSVCPRSGGEYEYLRKTYHPLLGFLSGWLSATVGFAAPVALAAMAFGAYMSKVIPNFPPHFAAIALICLLSLLHSFNQHAGFKFQRWFTGIKISLILLFVLFGLLAAPQVNISFVATSATWDALKTPAFAVSLVFVAYAYSGWNAAAYVAGEIENPRKNLPSALLTGTLLVTLLYTLLNLTFLKTIPIDTLASEQAKDFGKPLEVAYFSAETFLGTSGAVVMAVVIAVLLISTISAMIIAGPRITQIMGRDLPILGFLGKDSKRNTPSNAILFQAIISSVLVVTSSFDDILLYI
jgi:APA family basic amino acid/polyamine antiporter